MPSAYATFNARRFFAAAKKAGHTTNAAIAKHLGVSESQVSRCAAGMHDPSFDTLVRIRDGYGLDFGDVVTYPTRRRLRPPGIGATHGENAPPAAIQAVA